MAGAPAARRGGTGRLQLVVVLCWSLSCVIGRHEETATTSPGRELLAIPRYVRGPQYDYVLSEADRENGISYLPAAERLRTVVDKLSRGQNISLVTIGASIMAGQGTNHGPMLPRYINNWFEDMYPGQVQWSNGAASGTTSAYLSVCHNIHVPSNADLVIVDYAISDWYEPPGPPYLNEVRRAYERLIRKLLNYPNRPAIVLLHAYAWHQKLPFLGAFWSNTEREFGEFERFYHLPSLSTKACCYHHLRKETEGFNITIRGERTEENFGKHFYFDRVHPDESSGCRIMAELVYHLVTKVRDDLKDRPLTDAERSRVAAKIPDPMIAGNFESASTRCFIANAFLASVASFTGWEWINESKSQRPKWGYISTLPGSEIRLKVDTRATSRTTGQAGEDKALVQLAHLKSYEGMGMASVNCYEGCACKESILEGHHQPQNSLMFLHEFYITPAENCIIAVRILPNTTSGQHKVKLTGVIISEVAGEVKGVDNTAAVEYVADIAMRSKTGNFDVNNHI